MQNRSTGRERLSALTARRLDVRIAILLPACLSTREAAIRQNRTLAIAIAVSVLAHGALLAVRFAAPDAFKLQARRSRLEVILVNAKHDKKPLKADALAQANLDGGGNADAGRAKSPLPDMRKTEDGDGLKAMQRRIDELEDSSRTCWRACARRRRYGGAAD